LEVLPSWSFDPRNEADLRAHFAPFLAARAMKYHFAWLVLVPAEIGYGKVTRYAEVFRYGNRAMARVVREGVTTEIQLEGTEDPRRVLVGNLEAKIEHITIAMGRGGEADGAVTFYLEVPSLPDLATAYALAQVLGREANFPAFTTVSIRQTGDIVSDKWQPWHLLLGRPLKKDAIGCGYGRDAKWNSCRVIHPDPFQRPSMPDTPEW
jgi:hypothetical protein